MEAGFKPLQGDDDVLLFNQSGPQTMLKLGQFRQEIREKFLRIVEKNFNYGWMEVTLDQYSKPMSVAGMFNQINWICSPRDGIDCEVLILGAKTWQKGKLRIQAILEFNPALDRKKVYDFQNTSRHYTIQLHEIEKIVEIKVMLDFCNEDSKNMQPESPLDDLRQMLCQENQQ
jgi:hypothetical protein